MILRRPRLACASATSTIRIGSGAEELRSVWYFDGAATGPAPTLTWRAVLGLEAVPLGSSLRARKAGSAPAAERRELSAVT
ncbi:hypothetical protein ACF09Y_22790 [Streptomyces massasporeus]|uniref:hypothetical protein n=1 Tax=Streptomyces massasporeus TaxID=67324 RepID=UPI0036FBC1E2